MKLKGIKGIALLAAAILLVIGSVAGLAVAAGGGAREEYTPAADAYYWWEALPTSPHHQQQSREVGILIFDRHFGIDISAMSWQELDELWDVIGHENQEKAESLFAQHATEKGFEIPGIATPSEEEEEFIPPPDATYWWEFLAPEYREHMIFQAKKTIPEALRCLWERLDWKGIELPIPRLEELDVMRLTPEEFETTLRPRLPLGRVTVEQWLERFVPPSNIIAVFGRTRTYDDPTGWFDALREVRRLIRPLYPRLGELGVTSIGIIGAGYIDMHLDPGRLTPEDAKANAARIYAMIAPKAEMVGIEDVPVVFVWGAGRTRLAPKTLRLCELYRGVTPVPGRLAIREVPTYLGGGAFTFKDPREHIHTPLPLDQGFRPVPGGAQVAARIDLGLARPATIGFPVRDPILLWPDDEDLTTTGHLVSIINTPLYQPLPSPQHPPHPELIGTIADTGSWGGRADVARIAIPDEDVIPYVRTGYAMVLPVVGWRDPIENEMVSIFGSTSGPTSGLIYRVGVTALNDTFGLPENQVEATIWVKGGDSGAPLFTIGPGAGVTVIGITWGWCRERRWIGLFSPVSGVMHELPGWYPYTR